MRQAFSLPLDADELDLVMQAVALLMAGTTANIKDGFEAMRYYIELAQEHPGIMGRVSDKLIKLANAYLEAEPT